MTNCFKEVGFEHTTLIRVYLFATAVFTNKLIYKTVCNCQSSMIFNRECFFSFSEMITIMNWLPLFVTGRGPTMFIAIHCKGLWFEPLQFISPQLRTRFTSCAQLIRIAPARYIVAHSRPVEPPFNRIYCSIPTEMTTNWNWMQLLKYFNFHGRRCN